MFGTALSSSRTSAEVETVETYRRYPKPEIVELILRPSSSTPPFFASSSPVEPRAPRNRSPSSSGSAASPLPCSSRFTEGRSDDHVDAHRGEEVEDEEEEREELNENKKGNYKGTPPWARPAAAQQPVSTPTPLSLYAEHAQQPQKEGAISTNPGQSTVMPFPSPSSCILVQLRWGFEAADLRRVYEMHEDAFPLSYSPAYYEWLLDHDACMGLVATVTTETYARLADAVAMDRGDEGVDWMLSGEGAPLAWFPGYTPSPAEAAMGPRLVPPSASRLPLTVKAIQERAQIDTTLTELEYIAKRKQDAEAKGPDNTMNAGGKDTKAEDKGKGNVYTEVIGFIIGQCAYARHDAGHLFTNPTAYIGSFVVDPRFQRCGLGSALLHRFLVYVTQQRPLYAQDFLHYDERKLIAMLVAAQLRKRNASREEVDNAVHGKNAACNGNQATNLDADDRGRHKKDDDGAASLATKASTSIATVANKKAAEAASTSFFFSLLHQVVSAYMPEALTWWEDRRTRQRLRARGLTEEEIDAQRYRDQLAPDLLTDEEAEEVRRDAKKFLVQMGMREVWLHCLPGNRKANQFYARRGFQLHRLLKDYYEIGAEKYEAYLLLYACQVDGAVAETATSAAVEERDNGCDGNAPGLSATAANAVSMVDGMDVVVQQHAAAAAQINNPGAPSSSPPAAVGGGLRRRYPSQEAGVATGEGPGTATEEQALSGNTNASLSAAGPTAGITLPCVSVVAASSSPPSSAADGSDDNAGAVTSASPASSPTISFSTIAVPIETQSHGAYGNLAKASWLSPRTYPVVADVVLCTAAEGQEEWQRRFGGSGDVTGRWSWWDTVREVALLANAVGLLCAVLWLAYNVGLTGKVE